MTGVCSCASQSFGIHALDEHVASAAIAIAVSVCRWLATMRFRNTLTREVIASASFRTDMVDSTVVRSFVCETKC